MKSKRWFVAGFVIGCLVGCVVGSYLEYTSRTSKNYRRIVKEYQYARDNFHLTDAEMAEFGKKLPQFYRDMEAQDRMAAFMALSAFKELEKGDIEGTKSALLWPIGSYYRVYREKGGDPDIMASIKEAAKEYPEIAAEIAKP